MNILKVDIDTNTKESANIMNRITTDRMTLYPISDEDMQRMIDFEPNQDMKGAYSEMLSGCKEHPEKRIWNAIWRMQLNTPEQTIVGDFSFKGLGDEGVVEIGYGIKYEFANRGYMTEAVTAVARWAAKQPGVKRVEAETTTDNIASQRVLEKAGFVLNGVTGEEGPRYVWKERMRGSL